MTNRSLVACALFVVACSESQSERPSDPAQGATDMTAGVAAGEMGVGGTSDSGGQPAGGFTTSGSGGSSGTGAADSGGAANGGTTSGNGGESMGGILTPYGGTSSRAGDGGSDPSGGTGPAGGAAGADAGAGGTEPDTSPALLVFSRTLGFRHDSIEDGLMALTNLAEERGWGLEATEDSGRFSDDELEKFEVVVFLSTSGEVFDESQQAALQRFIQAGGGYVGIHAASTTEYDWPWYGGLVGAYFDVHPEVQQATIVVEDDQHASTVHLSERWVRTDEWYGFRDNPRDRVQVLLSLDESSYAPGESTMGDHPIAWFHEYDGGRAFYTALGHTAESYSDPLFMDHLAGGIEWALGQ